MYRVILEGSMFEFLKKIIPGSSQSGRGSSVLGIDIGSSAIKVVQLRKKDGKAVLETYGALALGPYAGLEVGQATNLDQVKIAQALADIIREAKVTTKDCAIAIPLSASLVRTVTLPRVTNKELATMVPIEARKYIPVPIGEVSLDWWVIPNQAFESETEDEATRIPKIEVLIAAIHNETVEKYKVISQAAGIAPTFYEIELFSTVRSVLRREMSPTLVIDIGAGATKVSLVERGVLKRSHHINRGSQDITLAISRSFGVSVKQAEDMKRRYGTLGQKDDATIRELVELTSEFIFTQAAQVALSFERQQNKIIKKAILTGGGALLKDLVSDAQTKLEMEVIRGHPFSVVEAPVFLQDVLSQAGPEFAVAIGLALRKLEELA